jgi:phosphoribosylglycinamide formyltransferase-1
MRGFDVLEISGTRGQIATVSKRDRLIAMNETTKRLVVLISGTGTTMQGVIDATRWRTLDAEVVAVFSHEPWSYGLLRAEREGIPANLHDMADYRFEGKTESEYNEALAEKVAAYNPHLVVLAGWKLPFTDAFCEHFAGRIVNLQQGVPGQYTPFDIYEQNPVSRAFDAYNAGLIREAHVTVHLLDHPDSFGRVVAQERVPIYEFDSLRDLEERMNRVQQETLVNTLQLLLREREDWYGSN